MLLLHFFFIFPLFLDHSLIRADLIGRSRGEAFYSQKDGKPGNLRIYRYEELMVVHVSDFEI